MISYSALHVFTARDQKLRDLAEAIVARFPDQRAPWLRCHEVARAVGRLLKLGVQDGRYGVVDHSWCRIAHSHSGSPYLESYVVLDPYAVGRLPQVQLVSPIVGLREYRFEKLRTDIDVKIVDKLVALGKPVTRDGVVDLIHAMEPKAARWPGEEPSEE